MSVSIGNVRTSRKPGPNEPEEYPSMTQIDINDSRHMGLETFNS
jgi:hypothetical protein